MSTDWVTWRHQARQQASQQKLSPQEVDWLLEHHGWSRLDQRLGQREPSTDLAVIQVQWQRRLVHRIPLQYLTGSVRWRDLTLHVDPSVLIPRPETELLVDVALQWIHAQLSPPTLWADLGTGSGAIALGLAQTDPRLTVYATDVSEMALAVAQLNTERLGLTDRVRLRQGSWFEPLAELKGCFQGILSNPPYIPTAILETLQPEVAWHEPRLALDGGSSGLRAIMHLISAAPEFIQDGGFWGIEVMQGQAVEVAQRLAQHGSYHSIQIHQDLAGIDRLVTAQLRTDPV